MGAVPLYQRNGIHFPMDWDTAQTVWFSGNKSKAIPQSTMELRVMQCMSSHDISYLKEQAQIEHLLVQIRTSYY